jgi:uncharacterized protein YecE (DUF72 family)
MEQSAREMVEFGTCSWNYDSWIGLVYDRKASRSAEYLREYSRHFSTVEVDSWFYKLPSIKDAREYRSLTGDGFSFSEKQYLPHVYELYEKFGDLIGDRVAKGSRIVKVYLNNHYEGCAPKSIERLRALL